jgi:lipoate-protein ligase A
VLNFPDEIKRQAASQRLLEHATTVEEVLGYPGDWWVAAHAFRKAFRMVLMLDLKPMGLTPEEGKRAIELYTEKYNNPDWINKN